MFISSLVDFKFSSLQNSSGIDGISSIFIFSPKGETAGKGAESGFSGVEVGGKGALRVFRDFGGSLGDWLCKRENGSIKTEIKNISESLLLFNSVLAMESKNQIHLTKNKY